MSNENPHETAFEDPQETAFDRLSRVLATPMPRRQALKMIAGVTLTSLGSSPLFAQITASKSRSSAKVPALKLPVHNFVVHGAEVYEVFNALREKSSVPVSYVVSESAVKFNINIIQGTVQDVLNQMTAQDTSYTWMVIREKLIFFPKLAKYQTLLCNIAIVRVPRYEAAINFMSYLREHVNGFQDFGSLLIGSMPRQFEVPVTISGNATVIECLTQLISDDPSVVFSITQSSVGGFYLFLNTVQGKATKTNAKTDNALSAVANRSSVSLNSSLSPSASSSQSTCRGLSENYDSPSVTGCPNGGCGAVAIANISGITACPGDDCTGKIDDENVTLYKVNPNGMPVCAAGAEVDSTPCGAIGAGNSLNCEDHYTFCMNPSPKTSCAEQYNQTGFVDGKAVGNATLTYVLTVNANGTCAGSFTRGTATNVHTSDQCCGNNPPTSGPGSKTLCNSPQTCINGDVCCDPGTLDACVHVCCAPKTASYAGDTCITDSVTLVRHCCPIGTPVSCSGVCCPKNNTCVGGNCCPQGQGTSDNKTCCPAGQSPQGAICCQPGQINCGGTCCTGTCDSKNNCVPPPNENK